jgi:hypothetical protein
VIGSCNGDEQGGAISASDQDQYEDDRQPPRGRHVVPDQLNHLNSNSRCYNDPSCQQLKFFVGHATTNYYDLASRKKRTESTSEFSLFSTMSTGPLDEVLATHLETKGTALFLRAVEGAILKGILYRRSTAGAGSVFLLLYCVVAEFVSILCE